MIAVDSNILVYAHRRDSEWHEPAAALVGELAEGRIEWAVPWACLHEFLAIVTHPRIYAPPSTLEQATLQVDAWLSSPVLVLLGETGGHWDELKQLLLTGKALGPMVHDARVAALCLSNGITELLTADRDFNRFPGLNTRNPLL